MKKRILLLLAAVLCLSLCACGGKESATSGKNAIIGEWKSLDGGVYKFDKDGTINGNTKWKYDKELDCFAYVSKAGINVNFEINAIDDVRYITILNTNYYYIDDYEKISSGIETKKNISVEELKQYYDTDTYAGIPRVEVLHCNKNTQEETNFLTMEFGAGTYDIEYNENYKVGKEYACIVVDGGNEEATYDDILVYVFTE